MSVYDERTARAIRRTPLPSLTRADLIAQWIDQVAPDGSLNVSKQITHYLTIVGVPSNVMGEAFRLSWRLNMPHPSWGQQRGPTMGPAPAFDLQRLKWRAQLLDARFQVAQRSGDTKAMADNAKALVELLRALGRMGRDRARMAQVRAEILRNAPNIARVVRIVGPRHPMPRPRGMGRPWFSPPLTPRPAR